MGIRLACRARYYFYWYTYMVLFRPGWRPSQHSTTASLLVVLAAVNLKDGFSFWQA